jgi:hypothetical protein
MSKDPAFLFYSKDFYTSVITELTMDEIGQYIVLLCLQHINGHLSKKNIKIAVGDVSPDVLAKFVVDADGLYYNERLEQEIIKRENYAKSRSDNIKKRWNKDTYVSKSENICIDGVYTQPIHSENENIDINIINSIYLYWNSKNIIVHKELNKNTQEAVLKALETYSEEQIKTCIDRYATVINDASYFWGYKWTLREFLTRKEGISAFTDEGSKWCSYQAFFKKPCGKGQNIESTFETDDFFQSALERSNKKMRERLGKK